MAVYKVPQDVEAEDKLIGWLSFRQFIYLGIAVGSGILGFFFFQISPVLVLIPLPFFVLFGTLALPIRKDQPLETYLLAIVRFYLKPKVRKWDPDGTITYVEITAPKLVEQHLAKEYGADTAQERLDYLARIMDSRGWSYKNVAPNDSSVVQAVASEATSAIDVLDESADLSKNFDALIARKDQERRQEAIARMQKAQAPTTPSAPPAIGPVRASDDNIPTPVFNPYPKAMHQKIILPMEEQQRLAAAQAATQKARAAATPPAPKPAQVSPELIRLANTDTLSVSTIAREAKRLADQGNGEVEIKLH